MCDFQGWFIKGPIVSTWVLGSLTLGGSRAPCCMDTHVALWRPTWGQDFRPPTKNQQQLANHVKWATLEMNLPPLQKTDILTAISCETWGRKHQDKLLPNSWPTETVRENKCLLFQAAVFWGNLWGNNRECAQYSTALDSGFQLCLANTPKVRSVCLFLHLLLWPWFPPRSHHSSLWAAPCVSRTTAFLMLLQRYFFLLPLQA